MKSLSLIFPSPHHIAVSLIQDGIPFSWAETKIVEVAKITPTKMIRMTPIFTNKINSNLNKKETKTENLEY